MEIIKQGSMSVLMLPWLGHGHISPYLVLAKKLASRNIRVYLCSTPVNLEPIKKKLSVEHSLMIQLVELHLPSSPQLPPHYHTTNGLPPHLMEPLKEALHESAPSFSRIIEAVKPDLVIYDFIQSWAPAQAASYNIPAVQFKGTSASSAAFFLRFTKAGNSDSNNIAVHTAAGTVEHASEAMMRSYKIHLLRTFREIEGECLDQLNDSIGKRAVPLGPLFSDPAEGEDEQDTSNCDLSRWLDKKEPSSTVLVTFGSEYFSPKDELVEIANALEVSKVNFIWVIRSPQGERPTLPDGFIERVGERGLVVEGWAPQMRILAHPSVGGFVSHCGWSSMLESMKLGVPIIGMPQEHDQPANAKVLSANGVGLEVRRDENGKYTREEIIKGIRKVMMEEDGIQMKRKATDLSQVIVKKSDEDVDEAVKELVRICNEYGNSP